MNAYGLAELPQELLLLALQQIPRDAEGGRQLCRLGQTCHRLRALHRDDLLWQPHHAARWRETTLRNHSRPAVTSWYEETRRRHTIDVDAVRCVEHLLKPTSRAAAWKRLLTHGEEALQRVCTLCTDGAWIGEAAARRDEAHRAAVALNQSVVRREWVHLLANAASGTETNVAEEGALLLVRLYTSAEELAARGPHDRVARVRAELDALAARLTHHLAEAGELDETSNRPRSAEAAVRSLSRVLFDEEGFSGNSDDYYNPRNSLLDHVLDSRQGIPISLSVLFASVCSRVGLSMDYIGLPGHFLLATRPSGARGRHESTAAEQSHNEPDVQRQERVFVDAFHAGALRDLSQCEDIVRSYGISWSERMATPEPASEVCVRMLRNLANAHQKGGELEPLHHVQAMLQTDAQTPLDRAAAAVPYSSPLDDMAPAAAGAGASALPSSVEQLMNDLMAGQGQQQLNAQQQALMRMLQMLHVQQQQQQQQQQHGGSST